LTDVLNRTSLIEYGMEDLYDGLDSDLELSVNCKKREVDILKRALLFSKPNIRLFHWK
jgi:hypothetical protein